MRDDDCVFCKIARGEIPSETIYEDGSFRVILDQGPATFGHALMIPKEHYRDLCQLDEPLAKKAFPLAGQIGRAMMKALGCAGFNVVQNNGPEAGQTVFHFHVHIIPRYEHGPAIVTWNPGETNPRDIAAAGEKIRQAL